MPDVPPPRPEQQAAGQPSRPEEPGAPAAERIADGMARLRAGDGDGALVSFADAARLATETDDAAGLSAALRHQSIVLRQRSEWDEAAALARRAAEAARAAGLRNALAEAYNAEAGVHQSRGAFDEAEQLLAEAFVTTDDRRLLGVLYANTGSIAAQRGDLEAARHQFLASAREFRACGYALGEATVLNNFGRTGLDQGNGRVAAPMLRDALGAALRGGDAEQIAVVRRNLAEALWLTGELDEAEAVAVTALEALTVAGNEARRAECLRVLGEIDEARGDRAGAVARWRAALAASVAAPPERERILARLSAVGADGGSA